MDDAGSRSAPTLQTLLRRLKDYTRYTLDDDATPERIASNIKAACLEAVICAGAVIDGKPRCLRFMDYYAEVFGRGLDGKVIRRRKRA